MEPKLTSLSRYGYIPDNYGRFDYRYTVDEHNTKHPWALYTSYVAAKNEHEARAKIYLNYAFFGRDIQNCLTPKARKAMEQLKHKQLELNLRADAEQCFAADSKRRGTKLVV